MGERQSKRLDLAVDLGMRFLVNERNVLGKENLENLPNGRPIIFATTHLSDIDVVAAMEAIPFKYKVVQAADHETFTGNPGAYLVSTIAGKNNFISINLGIHQEDFLPMTETLTNGKAIIMAAYYNHGKNYYNDTFTQKGVILPENGGIGAIVLAQKSGAIVVPTGVSVDYNEKGKKVSTVTFGSYLDFEKIEDIEEFLNNKDDKSNKEMRRKVLGTLIQQSNLLMTSLARLIPEEKRGVWKEKI